MPLLVPALLTALVTGVLGAASSGWARRAALSPSRWLRPWVVGAVAALGGLASGLITGARPWDLVVLAALAVPLAMLLLVDLAEERLPDLLVGPSYALLAALVLVGSLATGDWTRLGRAALGAGAVFAFYLLVALVFPTGIYFGDVKLSGVLGGLLGWLGYAPLIAGFIGGFLVGGVASVVVLAVRRDLRAEFPFGPWMIIGAFAGAAWGPVAFPVFTMI